jgi:hypothetical protein
MAQTLIWWVKKGNETPAKKVWVSHYGEVWYEKDIQIKTDLLDICVKHGQLSTNLT